MADHSETALQELCQRLHMDFGFFHECLRESAIEIREIDGRLDLDNGSALTLRRLERICAALEVDVPVALLLRELRRRVSELEEEVRVLRRRGGDVQFP